VMEIYDRAHPRARSTGQTSVRGAGSR
jgi:hypothetical protein